MITPTINSLFIYPIKSLGHISLNEVVIDKIGIRNDRNLMLVDSSGCFITKRKHAHLSLFKTKIINNVLEVHYQSETLSLPLNPLIQQAIRVDIWKDKLLHANIYPDEINKWFSKRIGEDCRLVSITNKTNRYKVFGNNRKTGVNFSDGYPILVLGTASVRDLSERMNLEMDPLRFRPNILINTKIPHIEDQWKSLKIGTAEVELVSPCKRCVVPTMDPESGEINPSINRELASYRKLDSHIIFGMNAIVKKEGRINLNQEIQEINLA